MSITRKRKVQSQDVSGDNAIGVQIDGDTNTVTIFSGGSRLLLDQPHKRRGTGPPADERQLLLTEWRATTLIGRQDELAALEKWRDSQPAVAIRCIAGRAGSGKTRLAIEACEAAEASGWTTGFVSGEELRRFHAAQNIAHWRPNQDIIVVIDDAAMSGPIVKEWFAAIARRAPQPEERKLRILLLERYADPDSDYGWWAELKRRDSLAQRGAADLIGTERPIALATIALPEERRALLGEAMHLAAGFLNKPALTPPVAGANPDFDSRLADDRLENECLFLVMAGIVAAERGAPAALALGRRELAKEIAGIERARIGRLGASRGLAADGNLIAHLAACVTLQRGCDFAGAAELVKEEVAAMGFASPVSDEMLVEILAEALPDPAGGGVDSVRPDMIGEAFLVREVTGPPVRADESRLAIIERARRRNETKVLEILVLAAQDFAAGDTNHSAVRWIAELTNRSTSLAELARIADAVPRHTLALSEVGATVSRRVVDLVREQDRPEMASFLAFALTTLGVRLGALGQREAALAAAQEAVELRRVLNDPPSDSSQLELAHGLVNLSNCLSEVGDRKMALEPAEEAAGIFRVLAAIDPKEINSDLAASLNNLATFYSDLGQHDKALELSKESVKIRRLLVARRPEQFMSHLATSLHNLASCHRHVGEPEDALAAAQEALGHWRTLAAVQPDSFNTHLATTLHNLGTYLIELGYEKEALAVTEEVVELRRPLALARPDAFNQDLATSLNNLANRYRGLGRHEDALGAALESVELFRKLALTSPQAFNPPLANALSVLADMLEENDRLSEAVVNDREAIALLSPYFLSLPDAFGGVMTVYIRDYARRLAAAGAELDVELLAPIVTILMEAKKE